MKLIKYLSIILIALAVWYFIFIEPPREKRPHTPVNTVSLHNTLPEIKSSKPKEEKIEIKQVQDNPEPGDDVIVLEKKDPLEEPNLGYITAYRDWKYFESCYTDVEDFLNDKDPLLTLKERFENNPRESQNEPTPQQNMYYEHHVEVCKGMIVDDKDDYYENIKRLEQRFKKIIPKTDIEKQLEHAIEMVLQLNAYKLQLSQAFYKKSNLPVEELNQINHQIKELNVLLLEVYYESDEALFEEQNNLIAQYSAEIKALRLRLSESRGGDVELIKNISATIDGYINSMDDYLLHVESPDAFLVISEHLYLQEYFQKDSTVLARMKSETGINDSNYINTLNKLVMPLVACSMNYPCDAKSDYILSYCLGLRDSMFNQACGKSLEDFYFSFYIGENQLTDINNYFSFLVNRYAH